LHAWRSEASWSEVAGTRGNAVQRWVSMKWDGGSRRNEEVPRKPLFVGGIGHQGIGRGTGEGPFAKC